MLLSLSCFGQIASVKTESYTASFEKKINIDSLMDYDGAKIPIQLLSLGISEEVYASYPELKDKRIASVCGQAFLQSSIAVLGEYQKSPEVTRKRLYLETIEEVLGRVDKVILDEGSDGGGQGVVPYLPLNELRRQPGGSN